MIDFEKQKELFKLIGTELRERTEAFLLGGSAMMFYGAKTATFDVDLVLMDEASFHGIKNALIRIGFSEDKDITIFGHYRTAKIKPVILKGRETRFDLFYKEVVCYKITDTILSRIREVHEFGNLVIKLVSPEDIFMLKCATEREKDLVDGAELAKKFKLNWNSIVNESIKQMEIGETVFPVFLLEFLHNLKDRFRIDVPQEIMDNLHKISEEALAKFQKK